MKCKTSLLAGTVFLSISVAAQTTPSGSLYFELSGGAIQTGGFAGGSSVRYKTKKNITFSIGTININARKEKGLSSKDGSDIHYGYMGFYAAAGKIIPFKNKRFFWSIQGGPSFTNKFEVAESSSYGWNFNFSGYTPPARPIPPPPEKKSGFGFYGSASINYQALNFMQLSAGANGNASPTKTFGGVYIGLRFGINNITKQKH